MTSSPRTALLAASAALAVALGAAAAHAGQYDLPSAKQAATTLEAAADGDGDDLVSQVVEAATSDETLATFLAAIAEAAEK